MQNDRRQSDKEHDHQQIPQEQISLREYAGDAEDDRLAREQANQYVEDCDRGVQRAPEVEKIKRGERL